MNRTKTEKITSQNYFQQAMELSKRLIQERGPKVYHIGVFHDDWCGLYSGKGDICNCNPTVKEIEI